jgi:NTE family protein
MVAMQRFGSTAPRIALVLGGGGVKGFAHIGVLKALEERGIKPFLYAGTSIGALLAAAAVAGMSPDDMTTRAVGLRRRDVFRINHFGMLMERMRAPAIYLEEPLRDLCRAVIPPIKFSELPLPLLVNTVDLDRGTRLVWGLPGLRDVFVHDAVYASCALPGYFPPGRVDGRVCVDGGVIDNLPVSIASLDADLVIAVDVGSSDLTAVTDIAEQGFAATYMRAVTTMMHALQQYPLERWSGPPMVLVRPKVGDDWLSFTHTAANIAEGYRAAQKALEHYDAYLEQPGGVYPRKVVELEVDRDKCIGCGLCVALAPHLMGFDSVGKAFARDRTAEWSPADGDFVHHCPTKAITARKIEQLGPPIAPHASDAVTAEKVVSPPVRGAA